MIDVHKREKGKYEISNIKIIQDVEYKMKEVTVVGHNYEILSYSREYSPGFNPSWNWEDF